MRGGEGEDVLDKGEGKDNSLLAVYGKIFLCKISSKNSID